MTWVIIGSGNSLSPVPCQVITWTNACLLSIGLLGTNFNEIWIGILPFSFKKIRLKIPSAKMVAIFSRGRWVKVPTTGGPLLCPTAVCTFPKIRFVDDILKCIFLNENVWVSMNISVKFVPKGSSNNVSTWVHVIAWRRSGDKTSHYLNQCWLVYWGIYASLGLNELML